MAIPPKVIDKIRKKSGKGAAISAAKKGGRGEIASALKAGNSAKRAAAATAAREGAKGKRRMKRDKNGKFA